MNEGEKEISGIKDLLKALEEFPVNPMTRDVTIWVIEVDEWLETFKEKVSAFQKDYNKQVHLSKKELRSVRKSVKDKSLQDFIDSLLKQHGM